MIQMNDHMRQSQAELNELLKEYWKLGHATGEFRLSRQPSTAY